MQKTESIDFKLWLIDEKRQVLGTRLLKYLGNPESLLHQLDSVSVLLNRLKKEFIDAFPQLTNVKSFNVIFTGKSFLLHHFINHHFVILFIFGPDEISGAKRDCILEQGVDLMCVIRTWQRAGKIAIPIDLWAQLPAQLKEAEASSISGICESVMCTECRQRIEGFRYKCLQCPDYILCGPCDKAGKHEDHAVIRFSPAVNVLLLVDLFISSRVLLK
jgi:hypothetical protein